jgi:hypothetical protein
MTAAEMNAADRRLDCLPMKKRMMIHGPSSSLPSKFMQMDQKINEKRSFDRGQENIFLCLFISVDRVQIILSAVRETH